MLFRLYRMGTIGTHNDRGFCVSKDTMSGFVLPFQNSLLPNLLLTRHEGVQVHTLDGVWVWKFVRIQVLPGRTR